MTQSIISKIQFGLLTSEEIKKQSVARIHVPLSKGDTEKDKTGTLYDERMGVLQNGTCCLTCGYTNKDCPGHPGHIELPVPVINKKYIKMICSILNLICPECKKSRIKKSGMEFSEDISSKKGGEKFAELLKECKNIKNCPSEKCGQTLPSFGYVKGKNVKNIKKKYGKDSPKKIVTAEEILDIFKNVSHKTLQLIGLNSDLADTWDENIDIDESKNHPHQLRPEAMIFVNLPVLPPISRSYIIRDGKRCDDDVTDKYNDIVKKCNAIEKATKSTSDKKITTRKNSSAYNLTKLKHELQNQVWELLENPEDASKNTKGRKYRSLGHRTTGKDGHVKSHVGGKRVDFCGRTVIAPGGLFIDADEVGVPRKFVETLTVEEKVLSWNFDYICDLFNARKINKICRDGKYIRIDYSKPMDIKIGDNIERFIRNGDYGILNRQPSLREESMMALKIRIIDGYIFRLPLPICAPFNADFDGDGNLHRY